MLLSCVVAVLRGRAVRCQTNVIHWQPNGGSTRGVRGGHRLARLRSFIEVSWFSEEVGVGDCEVESGCSVSVAKSMQKQPRTPNKHPKCAKQLSKMFRKCRKGDKKRIAEGRLALSCAFVRAFLRLLEAFLRFLKVSQGFLRLS